MKHHATHGGWRPFSVGRAAKHALVRSTRRRLFAPVASFSLAGAVIVALLVGLGTGHHQKRSSVHSLRSTAELGPLPGRADENPDMTVVTAPPGIPTVTAPTSTTSTTATTATSALPATGAVGAPTTPTTSTTSTARTALTPPAPAPPPVRAAPLAPSAMLQGAYAGGDNPSGISAFDSATGTHVGLATDYLPGSSGWTGMDGSAGSPVAQLAHAWAGTGYALSLGVPIIPTSGGAPVGTLATGATGAYNSHFVTLAQTLVAGGEGNAFLRLGWEFDGSWFAWNATTPANEAAYAAYFVQIVTAMRSVPGESFRFVWNPDAGAFTTPGYNVALAYPGSAYVNDIGLDAYDQSWASPLTAANAWSETTLPTLVAAHGFAAAQGRPLAICEWGLAIRSDGHGLGDDPTYINNFLAWITNPADNVAYESYFDADAGGTNSVLTGGDFPNSLAAFRTDLG